MAQTTFFSNFGRAALAEDAAAAATTLAVDSAAAFPAVPFVVVLTDARETVFEVCNCTAKGAATLTVARAREGTAALDWPAGSKVENRLTAATLSRLEDMVNTLQASVRGTYKRLLVTSSKTLADPSGGRATEFVVTMVGGGAGGGLSGTVRSAGGGGEGVQQRVPANEIAWSKAMTIGAGGAGGTAGAAGGTTSWDGLPQGLLRAVEGGKAGNAGAGGAGGGNGSTRNRYVVYFANTAPSVYLCMGGASGSNYPRPAFVAPTPLGMWATGGGGGGNAIGVVAGGSCAGFAGSADGGGASLLGNGGESGAYVGGRGGGGNATASAATAGAPGAILLEWYE